MTTTINGVVISPECSQVLQAWIREVGLKRSNGSPITLRAAAELILEDFAEVLSTDEDLLEKELEFRQRVVSQ